MIQSGRAIKQKISTKRLILQRATTTDADAMINAINSSLDDLKPWMHWARQPYTLEQAQENLTKAEQHFATGESLRYHIWLPNNNELIGSTGFHALNWQIPKGEIGYWISSKYKGQGYAQEVTQTLTQFAFTELGFRRLEIRCDAKNKRSIRIPEALGFNLDACLINDDIAANAPNTLRDTLIYSLVR